MPLTLTTPVSIQPNAGAASEQVTSVSISIVNWDVEHGVVVFQVQQLVGSTLAGSFAWTLSTAAISAIGTASGTFKQKMYAALVVDLPALTGTVS
jgi:hypothetical protein